MARPAGPQIRFGLLAALQPRTESPSNESGNSPADYASTTATSPSSIASSLRSKLNSRNGPNPMTLFGYYAQLLKASCLERQPESSPGESERADLVVSRDRVALK